MTAATPILPAHIEDTIAAIAKLHADHRQETGALQHFVDRLIAWIGRPQFIAGMTVAVALWVAGVWRLRRISASCPPSDTGAESLYEWRG